MGAREYGIKLENGHRVSRRAYDALQDGRCKLPQAVKQVRTALPVSKEVATHLLHLAGGLEWHHVGNAGNKVYFYDPKAAIEFYNTRPSGEYAGANNSFDGETHNFMNERLKTEIDAKKWAFDQGWVMLGQDKITETGLKIYGSAKWA